MECAVVIGIIVLERPLVDVLLGGRERLVVLVATVCLLLAWAFARLARLIPAALRS